MDANAMPEVRAVTVGGPTAILEVGGLRLLLDPTFDEPGEYGRGSYSLSKTHGPAMAAGEIGHIDAVLLSHDQHPDNLDTSGRTVLAEAPVVLTTIEGADRLGGSARPLERWAQWSLARPDGGALTVTSVPAQHGPDDTHHLLGEVTGFVLRGEGLPTVYVSGDNASLDVVRDIAERIGKVDIAVLFAGGAQTPALGDAYLTVNSEQAAEAASILGPAVVLPVHFDGWAHFSEGGEELRKAFAAAGIEDRLALHPHGTWLTLWPGGSAT